jgi:VanZ family protein
LAILAAVTYGASDEFHQLFVAYRNFDVFDLMMDFIGGTIGAIFYGRYNRI